MASLQQRYVLIPFHINSPFHNILTFRNHFKAPLGERQDVLNLFQRKIIITCKEKKCGKQFTSAYNYQLHVKCHQQHFNFICQICGKGFINRNHHDSHTFTHLKEKPFPCHLCNKCLLTKSNLQCHRQSCRQIVKSHQCILHGKKFLTEMNLICHQSQAHKSF